MKTSHFIYTALAAACSLNTSAAQTLADCTSPFILGVNEYHHQEAPNGHGNDLEVAGNGLRNKYFIDKEHNSVWYKFTAIKDGSLVFSILPDSPKDDYDFMLFRQAGDDFCQNIKSKSELPVRTNFARNVPSQKGATGLKKGAAADFVGSGPGANFSKPLPYKKGDVFYLLVDNVYPNGKGHTIRLDGFFDEVTNPIKNTEDTAVIASRSDNSAKYEEKNDKKSTDSQNKTEVNEAAATTDKGRKGLELVAENSIDPLVMADALLKAGGLTEDGLPRLVDGGKTPAELKNSLSKLKKGQALILENVYFHGNSAFLKTESQEQIEALYEFLVQNPTVKIAIGGHTNGHQKAQTHYIPNGSGIQIFAKDQFAMLMSAQQIKGNTKKLSEHRASVIKTYLESKGIEAGRLKSIGWGAEKMLFSEDSEMSFKNRRVEVELLE